MSKFGIGQAVRRVEDRRFLTGAGSFVGDMALPRQCYGVPVLSPHAHARIKSIDTKAARSAPGVLAVLTGADAAADRIGGIPPYFMPEAWGGPKGHATVRPVLFPTACAASATAWLTWSPKPKRRRAMQPS